jgi:glycine/D-amino acid oxidase-like deaminating enzyme
LGDKSALELVQKRWTGLQLLRKRLGDQALGYRESGSVELFLKGFEQHSAAPSAEELEDLNRWIAPVTGTTQTFKNIPSLHLHGMDSAAIEQAVSSPLEGCVDTGQMMHALQSEVHKAGIDLVHGCHVTGIQHGLQPRIRISETTSGGTWFETERLLLTTNAFARELLDDLDVHPATNLVLVTEPLQTLLPQPTVHIDAGYVYARSIENRLLIGGGRHWGLDNPEELEARLLGTMRAIWPESKSVKIDQRWTGVLGIGKARLPIVEPVQSGIHVAVRLGGMGVAMGMQCGNQAAELVAET